MMKKMMFLAAMLIAVLVFAESSQAIIINEGALGAKYSDNTYTDFDFSVTAPGGGIGPAPGQTTPSGNVWGIVALTGIYSLADGNPENNNFLQPAYYNNGEDGKFYYAVYGGLTYLSGTVGTTIKLGDTAIDPLTNAAITPYLKIYETTTANLYNLAMAAGPNVADGGQFGTFAQQIIYGADGLPGGTGVNADSTLWLDTTFVNTIQHYDATAVAGELGLDTPSTSVTGSIEEYLKILGGTGASLFQTGVFPVGVALPASFPTGDPAERADLKVISDSTLNGRFVGGSFVWNVAAGGADLTWNTTSQDPITGVGVPEPGTIVLLGTGLLGLGMFTRKRIKK